MLKRSSNEDESAIALITDWKASCCCWPQYHFTFFVVTGSMVYTNPMSVEQIMTKQCWRPFMHLGVENFHRLHLLGVWTKCAFVKDKTEPVYPRSGLLHFPRLQCQPAFFILPKKCWTDLSVPRMIVKTQYNLFTPWRTRSLNNTQWHSSLFGMEACLRIARSKRKPREFKNTFVRSECRIGIIAIVSTDL